jgi:hypothetical protein
MQQRRLARDVYVAKTTAQARREVLSGTLARDWRDCFLPLLKKIGFLSLAKTDPDMPDCEVTVEYLAEHIWLAGDPDTVTQKLQKPQPEAGRLRQHARHRPRMGTARGMGAVHEITQGGSSTSPYKLGPTKEETMKTIVTQLRTLAVAKIAASEIGGTAKSYGPTQSSAQAQIELITGIPRALGAGANFGGFQRGRSDFHVAPFGQGRG